MSKPSWLGYTLGGRYQIEELLGQGGMSTVYKATDPNLRRTVAVKLIHSHLSNNPEFVRRFEEEAASVAQLRHPNIIHVYDFNHDEDTYYMILEYVAGDTLQHHLKTLRDEGRQMPLEDVIRIGADLANAVDYAHQRGMIHRDIKPANVMLDPQGQAILMDFGIAKMIGGETHTATGAVVGTALYMSPEQVLGNRPTAQSDIYALGVTLFEMVSGRPPFEGDSAMSVMMAHVNQPVPDLNEIAPGTPAALKQIIEKALAKDPADRYATAGEIAVALRSIDLAVPTGSTASTARVTKVEKPAADATFIEDARALMPPLEQSRPNQSTPTYEAASAPQNSSYYGAPAAPSRPARRNGGMSFALIGGGIGLFVLLAICIGGGLFLAAPLLNRGKETATPTQEAEIATATSTEAVAVVETTIAPPTQTEGPTLSPTPTDPTGMYARINSITIDGDHYVVNYETFAYQEKLPGMHVHFFFNTVTPEQAGVPGAGPWILYGGPRPFTGYKLSQKPAAATQMCALVANPDHSVILDTGNCVDLPEP